MISDVFREVEVVDPRHIDKVNLTSEQVAENTDADIVLFMFNDLSFKDMTFGDELSCARIILEEVLRLSTTKEVYILAKEL